jgi:hypothetical protein
MNNTLHTPGPWSASPYNNITSRNGTVAKTEQMPGNDENERIANARLIASAPDLLEALQVIADGGCFDQGPNCLGFVNMSREQMMIYAHSVWMDAREAIAKAEGAE